MSKVNSGFGKRGRHKTKSIELEGFFVCLFSYLLLQKNVDFSVSPVYSDPY